jgi:hypothetical protein
VYKTRLCWVVAVAAIVLGCGGTLSSVRLQPEVPTTLHVGQTATVQVPSDRHYHVSSAGSSLALAKETKENNTTIYVYHAVEVGNQTLVATPREPGPGGCISCVTVHYVIQVVQ